MADNTSTSKKFVVERKLSLPGVEEPSEETELSNAKREELVQLKSPSKAQKEILDQLSHKEEQIKVQERERRRHRTMAKTTRQSGSDRNSNRTNTIQSQPPPPLSLATPEFIRKVSLPEAEEPSEELPPSTTSQREKLVHLESPSNEQKAVLARVELALAPEERIKAQERSRRASRSKNRLPEHYAPQQNTNTNNTSGSGRYNMSLEDIEHNEMENSRLRKDQKGNEKQQRLSSKKKWLHPQRSSMTTPPNDHHNENESHNELSSKDRRAKEQAMNGRPTLPRQSSSGMTPPAPIMESETMDDTDHAITNEGETLNDTDHAINNDDTDHAVKSGGSSMFYTSSHKKGSVRSMKSGGSFFDDDDDDSRNKYTGVVPVGAVAVDVQGERFLAKANMNPIPAPSNRTINHNSHNINNNNLDLVHVPQESSHVPQESFTNKETSSSSPSPSWWSTRQCKIVVGIVLVVAIIAISVAVALSGSGSGSGSGSDGTGGNNDQDEKRAIFLKEILYDVSGDLLDESSTPQNLAYEWILIEDTQISTLTANPIKIKARYIMALFYYATGGNTTWRNQHRWLKPDVDECQWPPLEGDRGNWCNGGQDMFGFYLDNWGLSGSLPKELVEFELVQLTFRNEDDFFNGVIDPVIYDMVSLDFLEMSNNFLVGSIPSELSKLTNLDYLSLRRNEFDGSFPSELSKLNKMKTLRLGENKIKTDMTQFVRLLSTEMVDLASLELNDNQIFGSIPSEIGRLDKLTHLVINDNLDINGNIPTELGMLKGFSYFDFQQTQITGTARPPEEPEEVCNLGIETLQCNKDLCDCVPFDECNDTFCCTKCS